MNSITLKHSIGRAWPIAIMLVLLVYFFPESAANLQDKWQSYEGYEHGFLVVAVWLAGLVMIESRGNSAVAKSANMGVILAAVLALALISFLNKVGAEFDIEVIQFGTIFVFAVGGALLITQLESPTKHLVLAIFLASGIPFWDFVLGILQWMTIQVTESFLQLLNVPVLFTGDVVDLPSGRFRIAEGCGGLRYFLSALGFSAFYVFLFIDQIQKGAIFVFVTCTLAIIANWIRVAAIIWIGYLSEMQSELVQDHYSFGWLVFAVFLAPSFWIGYKLQDATGSSRRQDSAPAA